MAMMGKNRSQGWNNHAILIHELRDPWKMAAVTGTQKNKPKLTISRHLLVSGYFPIDFGYIQLCTYSCSCVFHLKSGNPATNGPETSPGLLRFDILIFDIHTISFIHVPHWEEGLFLEV